MRALLQRVTKAGVSINGKIYAEIKGGFLVLLGIENSDNQEDIDWLANKILNIRLFNDSEGKMNLSLRDIDSEILIISQFTLHASTKKGNRPSFQRAAPPNQALELYKAFVIALSLHMPGRIKTGKFAANMQVSLVNDGPVTILLDSRSRDL